MINPLLSLELFHLHGERRERMQRRAHHSPVEHDVERALAAGAELYVCPSCDEIVLVRELVPGRPEPQLEP